MAKGGPNIVGISDHDNHSNLDSAVVITSSSAVAEAARCFVSVSS